MSTILNLDSRSKNSIAKTNGTSAGLSSSIKEKLEVVVRMAHRNAMVRGTAYVVGLVLASILMYLAIDALFSIESQWIRGITLLVLAILGIGSSWLFVVRSRPTKNDLLNAAWKIEDQCPELEERLLSTVQLLGNDAAKCAGSEQLIDALANEAAAGLEQVDPGEVKDHSTIYPVSIATALMCTALLVMLIWPGTVFSSLGNLVMPWRIPPVPPLQVHIEPGSVSIVKGQPISITAKFGEQVDRPVLELFDQNGQVIRQTPMKVNDNASTVAINDLRESADYQVRAGKKTSAVFSIKVLTKPVIESVECKLEFPAYTNLGTATIEQVAEPLTVPVGTKIKLSVPTPNGSIRGYLKLGDQKKIPSLHDNFDVDQKRQSTCNWEFRVHDKMDSVALLQLESEEGVTSDPFRIEITAVSDSAPEITILSPGIRHLNLARDVELPVAYSIKDDFGVSGVELVTQIIGQKEIVTPCADATHDTENPGTYLGRTAIAFSEFESDVPSVKFWIRARDNRDDENGGPQVVESEKTTVVFEQDAASFGKQQIDTEFEIARQAIEDSVAQLQLAKQQAELLESKLADSNEAADFSESKKLRDDTKLARETLLEQAKQVEHNTDLFKPLADQMKDIAEQEATRADIEANQIPLTDDHNFQQSHVEKTAEEIDSAIEKLNDLNSQIEEQKREMELAAELDELARKQEKLADDAKRRNGENPTNADAKSDQWKKEQEKLAEQIQNQVDQNPAAKREQILAHAEQAQRLADEAEQLAQQQEQLAEMPADEEGQPLEHKQLEKQLSEMLAREQEAIKEQTKEFRDKNADNGTNEKELDRLQNAEKAMEDVISKLQQPNQDHAANQDHTAKQDENDRQQDGEVANQQNENQLKEAAKNARMAAEKLQQRPDKKAQQANKAGEETDEKPDQNQPGKPDPAPANNENGERQEEIAEQQKNVADALEALDNGDVQKAAAKLQKQIADRANQLKRDAEKLEQKNEPNEQIQNQKRDALEKIKQAEQAANDADLQMNGKKENNAQNQEKPNQEKQNKGDANNQPGENKQNKNEQADEKAANQNQKGQQPGSQAKPNSNNDGNQQKQSGENKQLKGEDKKQPTKGGENKQNSKQGGSQQDKQNQQQGQSYKGQQRQQNDDGQPDNQKQNSDQGQNKNQAQNNNREKNGGKKQNNNNGQKNEQAKPGSKNPGKDADQGKQGAKQAQKQAAQSLREASKSLQQVCQECRQCKECQNPGGGDSNGAGKSKNGDASKSNKQGNESTKKESSDKQNESQQGKPKNRNRKEGKESSDKGDQSSKPGKQPGTVKTDNPDTKNGAESPGNEEGSAEKSLANAADKSNEASKSQNGKQASDSAEQAAKELNKAADQAAKRSGYKLRNAGQCNGQCENPGNSPGQSSNGKQPGESQKKSDKPSKGSKPGSSPKGVDNKGSNPELDGATLRGGSSSNWTRGRKQHKGGVLDDRSGNVPEEYRGLVEDYFKELARRGKDHDKTKTDKKE